MAFNASGIFRTGLGSLTLQHNCVYANAAYNYSGLIDPTGTNGNISADPKLADVALGNTHHSAGVILCRCRRRRGSPARMAGY